jgi:hypothetical protein
METNRRDVVRGKLLQAMPKGAVAAEVGVWEGAFSKRILEICQPRELHLIDPWLYQPEFANTGFGRPKNENLMDEKFRQVQADFAADPRVKIHRATSEAAFLAMPDASLDWVYLDGNHNAPFIDRDLELSLQKVKPNGIIAGDDFNWQAERSGAPVKAAVEKVMAALGSRASLRLMANQFVITLARG